MKGFSSRLKPLNATDNICLSNFGVKLTKKRENKVQILNLKNKIYKKYIFNIFALIFFIKLC